MLIRLLLVSFVSVLFFTDSVLAAEDAKVMPAKIRRATVRYVRTDISAKTDGGFNANPLSKPLSKALTFRDILKGEKDPVKNALTAGFLTAEGFRPEDAVGQFAAEVKTRVQVTAPVFTLGLTPSTTVAVALPVYKMQTAAAVSFQANDMGQKFINALTSDFNNQSSSARDAAAKLNDAVARLNTKLTDNGYLPLQSWTGQGLGDTQFVVKNRTYESGAFAVATQASVTAPTGRTDDPDNLLDKGFGDGQWDLALGTAAEQSLAGLVDGLSVSQFVRYVDQLPAQRTLRLVTSAETIEVPKAKVSFDLGNRLETGAAALLATQTGWGGVLGYNYSYKASDRYETAQDTRSVLEKDTIETLHQAEAELIYSGVPAFRRGSIPVPFEVKLAYKRQIMSRNMPVSHQIQLDTGVFF
ncbi:MAG: hypothetical protein EBR09_07320 [Proteobacteria bacterium]|nr:hypothetical protein [Pseudomonadota bacterium]